MSQPFSIHNTGGRELGESLPPTGQVQPIGELKANLKMYGLAVNSADYTPLGDGQQATCWRSIPLFRPLGADQPVKLNNLVPGVGFEAHTEG